MYMFDGSPFGRHRSIHSSLLPSGSVPSARNLIDVKCDSPRIGIKPVKQGLQGRINTDYARHHHLLD